MRQLPGIDPDKLPAAAALAAAGTLCLLLGGAVAVYGAVDLLGGLLTALFVLASLGLAASGWIACWRAGASPVLAHPMVERRSPLRNAGQDSPTHRLLEAVAVEVKSSATTLQGFAELVPAGEDDEPRSQLLAGSRSLLAFAGQLHDYIRFERGRLRLKEQQVDAGELVEAALVVCRASAETAGTTIMGNVFEGVELSCDAERIRQAIASLVLWAVQSSTPGGTVEVSLVRLPGSGLAVDIVSRAEVTGGPQPRERLFEPQLAQAGLRGLALPLARRMALLHSGEVTATSNPGEGTRARLTLPAERVAWPDTRRPARAA